MTTPQKTTCLLCTQSCLLHWEQKDGQLLSLEGHRCFLGGEMVERQLLPQRGIFWGMVAVERGEQDVVPVKTSGEIPLKLFSALREELQNMTLQAPVKRGQLVTENVLHTGANLHTTSPVYCPGPAKHSRFLQFLSTVKKPRFQTALCAHRGDLEGAPENTLSAFHSALDLEVDIIEMDIHLTKDEELIVFHDTHLDRTTDGMGIVQKFTLAELKKLSAGEWFGEEFAAERIPTLTEVLNCIKNKTVALIEVKSPLEDNRGIEDPLFSLLREMDMEDRVMISTRSMEYALKIKKQFPQTWVLHLSIAKKQLRQLLDTPLDGATPYWRILNPDLVQDYHDRGKIILPWTVDNLGAMESMIDMGLDGIISNKLLVLSELLLARAKIGKINPLWHSQGLLWP